MISAVVLTKNEEKNIAECLISLKWCEEILVIDDNSIDKTAAIARQEGARVIKKALADDFASQRNFALSQVKNAWVFFVDADERVSRELEEEIKGKIKEDKRTEGYFFKRIDFFMGRWLKYGEIGGIKLLRLAKKGSGRWIRRVDEKWEVRGKVKWLKNPLLHYSHTNLTGFLESINERSSLNAKQLFEEGKKVIFFDWFKPLAKFVRNYLFKLGFLDETQGFVFAVIMSMHSFLVRGKLYLLWRKEEGGNKGKRGETGNRLKKISFLLWTIFVFLSYIFYLFQRGKAKW